MALKGSKTEENLKPAFALKATTEDIFTSLKKLTQRVIMMLHQYQINSKGETGLTSRLEYLEEVGDPATGKPIGETKANLASAVAGETHEYTDMYPGMAKTARDEGFDEIADWFETLAKAEKSHAGKFKTLESIK